jgi:hypothetical protein
MLTSTQFQKYLKEESGLGPIKLKGDLCYYEAQRDLHAFKKVKSYHGMAIANLVVRKGAIVCPVPRWETSEFHTKLKADSAFVHSVVLIRDKQQINSGYSGYSPNFAYVPGSFAVAEKFTQDNSCGNGIFFFMTLDAALQYTL